MAINSLMQFVTVEPGTPIVGESQSVVDPEDDLAVALGTTWEQGYFFEIEDFEFSLELDESSGAEGGRSSGGGDNYAKLKNDIDELRTEVREMKRDKNFAAVPSNKKEGGGKAGGAGRSGGRFDEYVTGTQDTPPGYKPRVAPFSFKKQVDIASMPLITSCFNRTMFKSATIIKRKDVGMGATAAGVGNLTYVRFDFLQPLITSIDLTVEEIVRQSVKFVSRQVTVSYAQQQASGQTVVSTIAAVLKLNG